MPRRRPAQGRQPFKEVQPGPSNALQANANRNSIARTTGNSQQPEIVSGIENLKSLLDDTDDSQPASSTLGTLDSSTAALHDELNSFRQRWKRELEIKKPDLPEQPDQEEATRDTIPDIQLESQNATMKDLFTAINNPPKNPSEKYALAKRLFLTGVSLEEDEMHSESIRYYKQAMHLCPDIERQIFKEQCEASKKISSKSKPDEEQLQIDDSLSIEEKKLPLLDRIRSAFSENQDANRFVYCRPAHRIKANQKHISDLPHDLILQLFRYVIGKELDLASLEALGLVCRGFYTLSQDSSIWRSICHYAWSERVLTSIDQGNDSVNKIDWRYLYMNKPHLNYDGVYISRTRYIRQGDVGFQDITYRPFHVVRYYRYLRFFPDNRVLILTTNEEPDKIIPIFRHALHSKQFSSELSILEGVCEFTDDDEVLITAEKDFKDEQSRIQQQTNSQRRQARFHWSRQTPLWQKFNFKFKLRTIESRPFKNNTLKWVEYSILSKTETGQELANFDLSLDTFPHLVFSRVKRFNFRLNEPLTSH